MKISAVINTKKLRVKTTNTPDGIIIAFASIATGIICGCFVYIYSDNGLFSQLSEFFINFATDFTNKNKPEIISGLIASDIPYFIFTLIFGTSAIGTVPIFLLSFFKAAGLGAVATHLYSVYSLEGIEYCLLVLFPAHLMLLLGLLMHTHSCCANSAKINRLIRNNSDENSVEMQNFYIRSALIYCVFALSSVIRFLSIISFSSLFSFG